MSSTEHSEAAKDDEALVPLTSSDIPKEKVFTQRLTLDQAQKAIAPKHWRPIRALTLWASGCRKPLLDLVPVEETWFRVIGTLVLVTAVFAGIAAMCTVGFVLRGQIFLSSVTIGVGAAWAIAILVFDRSLVKMPMNPVRFSPRVLDLLWNPGADANAIVAANARRSDSTERSRLDFLGVGLMSLPRFAVAIGASFIFAETLLYVYYMKDLEPIVNSMGYAIAQQELTNQQKLNDAKIGDIDARIATLSKAIAPQLNQWTIDLSTDQKKQDGYKADVTALNTLYGAELNGRVTSVTLSDGIPWTTTGVRGAPAAQRILDERANRQRESNKLDGPIGDLKKQIADSRLAIAQDAQMIQLLASKAVLSEPPVAPDPTKGVQGIGVRLEALLEYEQDQNPATIAIEKLPDCAPGWGGFWCTVRRTLIYPSPAGPNVAAARAVFLFIELSPIIAKIAFVLRRRRPYDMLSAAYEEISQGASVRLVGEQLSRTGAAIEMDSQGRRAMRSAAAAEYTIARAELAHSVDSWKSWLRRPTKWRSGLWYVLMPRELSPEVVRRLPNGAPRSQDTPVDLRLEG